MHFDDEDVTETVVEFLEDFPKRLIENKMNSGEAANQFEQIIVEIYKDLEYSNEDNVVEISLEISSDSDLFKSFFHGFKEASQKPKVANSVVAVKNIGQSIEQYVMDNYRVGSPKVANIDDLMTILEATEILSVRDFMKDDWGNSLVYIPDSSVGSRSYKLISYGSDGKPGPQPQNGGVYNSKIDIIWENGRFIQLPN